MRLPARRQREVGIHPQGEYLAFPGCLFRNPTAVLTHIPPPQQTSPARLRGFGGVIAFIRGSHIPLTRAAVPATKKKSAFLPLPSQRDQKRPLYSPTIRALHAHPRLVSQAAVSPKRVADASLNLFISGLQKPRRTRDVQLHPPTFFWPPPRQHHRAGGAKSPNIPFLHFFFSKETVGHTRLVCRAGDLGPNPPKGRYTIFAPPFPYACKALRGSRSKNIRPEPHVGGKLGVRKFQDNALKLFFFFFFKPDCP